MPVPDKTVSSFPNGLATMGQTHLILPWAGASQPQSLAALSALELPHLCQLLATWHPGTVHALDEYSLDTPHERALAHALGWAALPDGCLPWAAWHAGITDRACAWFTPCHWSVGMEQVTLLPPDGLALTDAESRALLAALRPFCEEDGIHLHFETAQRWRAEGEVFADLPWASLDRVAHRRVDPWLPNTQRTPQARPLLRLQNEAQMLFYTHPVNDERGLRGQALINGFWISGTGRLPADTPALSHAPTVAAWDDSLRPAALQGDWHAWAQAWRTLDERLRDWLARAGHEALTLTLCGERGWQSWHSRPPAGLSAAPSPTWWRKLAGLGRKPAPALRPADVLGAL
jgi:hypothetical protein